MSASDSTESSAGPSSSPAGTATAVNWRLRLWPAVVIVVLQAASVLIPAMIAPGSFPHFMAMVFGPILGTLAFGAWWLVASRATLRARLQGVGVFLAAGVCTGLAVHATMRGGLVFYILPTATTGLVIAALATRRLDWPRRRWVLGGSVVVLMAAWTLVRVDGMDGSLNADFSWRWSPTSEERFLASAGRPSERTGAAKPTEIDLPSELQPGDWPGFRGADRDGRASGVTFDSDWGSHPPRELWRRRVGPGWSSFTVVGPYLFTQEQQGEDEAVVCYRLTDGQPCWVNTHRTRFSEVVSGAGPRATPTFHQGRLYTMGANGTVQCLDATDGHAIWSREAVTDTDAEVPIWGFASSPLVVGNLAVVFAGGTKGRSVVAYRCDNGAIAWVGGEGRLSYSSPQLVRFGESELILMATETGLQALEPGSGRSAWRHDWPTQSMRIVQPQLLGHGQVLFASGYGTGTRLLRIGRRENGWDVAPAWSTKDLEPYFNDSVGHQGYVYGFDGKVLACIDLRTGKRRWKGGRYGYGQILLLPEMDLLLVLSETGDAVLVKADPPQHRELGRFQAVNGKTWNHPVIAHDRLLVRNSEEAACFELIAGSPEKR